MSDASFGDLAAAHRDRVASDGSSTKRSPRLRRDPGTAPPLQVWRSTGVALVGGSSTGVLAALVLSLASPAPSTSTLLTVPAKDIEVAAGSLEPQQAPVLISEARSCRQPLAMLVIKAIGPKGGGLRIRSGTYLSPILRVGPNADRIAIPFPAPYAAGRGQIEILNGTDGVDVFLTPGVRVAADVHRVVTNVSWPATSSCTGQVP